MKLPRFVLVLLVMLALPAASISQSSAPAKLNDSSKRSVEAEQKMKQQSLISSPSAGSPAPTAGDAALQREAPKGKPIGQGSAGDPGPGSELEKEIKALEDYVANLSPDADSPLRDRLAELYRARERMTQKK